MRKRWFWLSVPLAIYVLGGYLAANDPIPYSLSCFQVERDARYFCHRQLEVSRLRAELEQILQAHPAFLKLNERMIVERFELVFKSGVQPEELGTDLVRLRMFIRDTIREHYGQDA